MQGQPRDPQGLEEQCPKDTAPPMVPATRPSTPPAPRVGPEGRAFPDLAAATAILAERYCEVTRSHLNRLPALFRALTGLTCHVAWASTCPHAWGEPDLPVRSALCRRLVAKKPEARTRCRECGMRHLALALKLGHAGHGFTCVFGVRNFWQPVIVRGCVVGLAFVQAPVLSSTVPRTGQDLPRTKPDSRPAIRAGATRARVGGAKPMSRAEFDRTARLLQLIFQHAETLTLADLRKGDLTKAQQALRELQTVATHLREDLNGLMPPLSKTPPDLEPLNHAERIAHDMLLYIRENYARPVTLKECAGRLGFNTAYLSTVFSRRVGLRFKAYLTEVRVEKAKELLGHSGLNISQVAAAVGYASENRFRVAFKHATGLSPSVWRETLRMKPG